jgi:hypothetical protein
VGLSGITKPGSWNIPGTRLVASNNCALGNLNDPVVGRVNKVSALSLCWFATKGVLIYTHAVKLA